MPVYCQDYVQDSDELQTEPDYQVEKEVVQPEKNGRGMNLNKIVAMGINLKQKPGREMDLREEKNLKDKIYQSDPRAAETANVGKRETSPQP